MILKQLLKLLVASSALALSACGGGSSTDTVEPPKANVLPTVAVESITANENTAITLTATASDSDGTISRYLWTQTEGVTIELTNVDTATVSFTAPSIGSDTDSIQLKLIVTDNDGGTVETAATVTINNVVPSVVIATVDVDEKTTVLIAATIDGQGDDIDTYLWTQTSGINAELTNTESATVTLTSPEISADEVITLSLTVTDIDGDITTTTSTINVKQLTIPLTITGLATDLPISNGNISVQVAGQEITIDVTTDENGVYSVDLLLDDSEADAFISIVARGVAEQANAGLISLLGTAEQLSAWAGDDNLLTESENFSVNITNISTAQYGLVKLANNGEDISSDEQLELLSQSLNFDEVIMLATAIKVVIDKAADIPNLVLPDGITDTLALVENMDAAQSFVQTVRNTAVYLEAQEEMYQDENLFDTSSTWNLPEIYYFLPQGSKNNGITFRFESNGDTGQGDSQGNHYTWQKTAGVITATVTDPKIDVNFEILNGFQVEVNFSDINYRFKRLYSGNKSDTLLLTTTRLTHYPNGEFDDEIKTSSSTAVAIKSSAIIALENFDSGIAYLPYRAYIADNGTNISIRAEEFHLNSDGTGHATVNNFDFNWQINNGALEINVPTENPDDTFVVRWTQLTDNMSTDQFAYETIENGIIIDSKDELNEGVILTTPLIWQSNAVVGIYSANNEVLDNPLEKSWYELRENGEADKKDSRDRNYDGIITENEITIRNRGSWQINNDGSLTITNVVSGVPGVQGCRYVETEGCTLYSELTWRLISQKGSNYGIFLKRDYKYSNFDWGVELGDDIFYTNVTMYKLDAIPVNIIANQSSELQ